MDWIPFNIWDDYDDESDDTYGCVEEYDELTYQQRCEVAKLVYDYILTLDMFGIEVELSDEEIDFEHLPHDRREALVEELQASGLAYNGVPIDFYSES